MRKSFLIILAIGFCLGLTSPLTGQNAKKRPVREVDPPWSFLPVVRPEVPKVENTGWVRNPIDAFVLARMEEWELKPSPEIGREKLLRRVYFDLIGLPPTPQEVEAFVNDKSPNAYEKVVDHLLNSPHYGERWAMYWLDLVRYAESDGFKADDFRPNAWHYRDYVIKSFNMDKPYDRFILEQLAGDELFPGDPDALVATAFNRHYPDEWNARNIDQRHQEILNDMADTTAQVFLGLTMGCAKCHDHKYDPVSQKDYYRFQAFFAAVSPQDNLPLGKAEELAQYESQMKEWETRAKDLLDQIDKLEAPYRKKLAAPNKSKFLKVFQDAYDTPYEQRTPWQKQMADIVAKQVYVDKSQMAKSMKGEVKEEWEELHNQMKAFDQYKPKPLPQSVGIIDIGPEAPPTHLLNRGNHKHPLDEVQPGYPLALDKTEPAIPTPAPGAKSTGRRSVLAKWLASPNNPLTARVMVNRLWQHHFGKGIVPSAADFGEQGDRPTHPELLDWLATEFIARGWSFKEMHRLMVTSNTYRQDSKRIPEMEEIDPDNRFLWKMNLRRLQGEAMRDAMLSVTGKLNLKMGGPSVFPKLPKGVPGPGWKTTPDTSEHNRRSIYIVVKRNLRYPLFDAFDAPDTNESCSCRHVSTNAPQALMLLNDDFSLQLAKDFAARLLKDSKSNKAEDIIESAFRLALGRSPSTKELALSQQFFQQQIPLLQQRLTKKQSVALPTGVPTGIEPALAAATVEYCHVVLNLNEFIYVD